MSPVRRDLIFGTILFLGGWWLGPVLSFPDVLEISLMIIGLVCILSGILRLVEDRQGDGKV